MIRLVLALGFLYLPLGVLVLFSFSDSRQLAFPITGLTLDWYPALFERQVVLSAFVNSLLLAQAVALVSTLLGLGIAYGLPATGARARRLVLAAVLSPFAIPKAVLGMALIMMLSTVGLPRGAWALGAAHVLMTLPFSTILIAAALQRLDPRLVEAARDLGASPAQAFRRVTLPLLRPALSAAYSLAAILSISDLTLATYLSGRFQTLSVAVASSFRTELTPDLPARETLVLVAIAAVAILNVRFGRRRGA